MLLHLGVTIAQAPEIVLVKSSELHRQPEMIGTIISFVDGDL
jgi:hypothetical protein